jgi:hypothetical protein
MAAPPVPRLIVSSIGGTGSMPMGCRLDIEDRDCAHPASVRPSIPRTIDRFIREYISIVGEFRWVTVGPRRLEVPVPARRVCVRAGPQARVSVREAHGCTALKLRHGPGGRGSLCTDFDRACGNEMTAVCRAPEHNGIRPGHKAGFPLRGGVGWKSWFAPHPVRVCKEARSFPVWHPACRICYAELS